MADAGTIPISALPAATVLADADPLPLVHGGQTQKGTIDVLRTKLGGSVGFPWTVVTFADSPYQILASDDRLAIDTSGGPVRVVLPADPSESKAFVLWKTTTDGNEIAVDLSGAQRINGDALGTPLEPVPFSDAGGLVMRWVLEFSGLAGLWFLA